MYAVEFKSIVRDDGSIVVPKELVDRIGQTVRVILLSEETTEKGNESSPDFSAVSIKTTDFTFNREYANER